MDRQLEKFTACVSWRRLFGERQEAAEHLTTATTMFREMDMGFWLEQSEAEIKELQ